MGGQLVPELDVPDNGAETAVDEKDFEVAILKPMWRTGSQFLNGADMVTD